MTQTPRRRHVLPNRAPAVAAAVSVVLAALAFVAGCDDVETGASGVVAAESSQPTVPARSSVAGNPAGWPPIEFEPPALDFGILPPGGTGRGSVKIWNVGSVPLAIYRGIVSCGCTHADRLDGRVIAPGSFTEFNTTMDMKSGLGEKREKLTIFFRGYERVQPPVIYDFTAEVSLPVRAVPPHLTAYDDATGGDILSGEFTLDSLDGRPFRILAVNGEPPVFADDGAAAGEPRSRYTLKWDLTPYAARGEVPWFWIVETDREDCPIIDLRVRHRSTKPQRVPGRRWSQRDQRIVVGVVRNNEPIEIETKIQYPVDMTPSVGTAGVARTSTRLDAELVEAWVEESYLHYRIRVTPLEAPPGLLYEEIRLFASGGEAPLRIIGRIAE
jgi:hypothetical protein